MTLTRTFQARIQISNWILIIALVAITIYFIWEKNGILITLSLLFLLLIIERGIHTEYRLNNESLTIHKGRLSKDIIIPIEQIKRIERIRKFRTGKKALITYLVVVYSDEKNVAITPQNEEGLISRLMTLKQNEHKIKYNI